MTMILLTMMQLLTSRWDHLDQCPPDWTISDTSPPSDHWSMILTSLSPDQWLVQCQQFLHNHSTQSDKLFWFFIKLLSVFSNFLHKNLIKNFLQLLYSSSHCIVDDLPLHLIVMISNSSSLLASSLNTNLISLKLHCVMCPTVSTLTVHHTTAA